MILQYITGNVQEQREKFLHIYHYNINKTGDVMENKNPNKIGLLAYGSLHVTLYYIYVYAENAAPQTFFI